jgi:hypothetical protein
LLEDVLLADTLKSAGFDLLDHYLFAGSDVPENPIAADAFDPFEVHDDNLASRAERSTQVSWSCREIRSDGKCRK